MLKGGHKHSTSSSGKKRKKEKIEGSEVCSNLLLSGLRSDADLHYTTPYTVEISLQIVNQIVERQL